MSALAAATLLAAAATHPGHAAALGGLGLSAVPSHVALVGAARTTIRVRNAGARPLVVDVASARFSLTLRGRPRVGTSGALPAWLAARPRRLLLRPGRAGTVTVAAVSAVGAPPGERLAVVLLTTRPVARARVRVRLRVGILVVDRIPGRIVRRLEPRGVVIRRQGRTRLFELSLLNRGNVTEQIGPATLRLVLFRDGRRVVSLAPRRRTLLPHSRGLVDFVYRGLVGGRVRAQVELRPPPRGYGWRRRAFGVRLR
jgi:hypothetical protein